MLNFLKSIDLFREKILIIVVFLIVCLLACQICLFFSLLGINYHNQKKEVKFDPITQRKDIYKIEKEKLNFYKIVLKQRCIERKELGLRNTKECLSLSVEEKQ